MEPPFFASCSPSLLILMSGSCGALALEFVDISFGCRSRRRNGKGRDCFMSTGFTVDRTGVASYSLHREDLPLPLPSSAVAELPFAEASTKSGCRDTADASNWPTADVRG